MVVLEIQEEEEENGDDSSRPPPSSLLSLSFSISFHRTEGKCKLKRVTLAASLSPENVDVFFTFAFLKASAAAFVVE